MKLFKSNIAKLNKVRNDLRNSFDHNSRIVLSNQDNLGALKLAENKITEAIVLLNKIDNDL